MLRIGFVALVLLSVVGLSGCADASTGVQSATANPTTAQRTRDTLEPLRGPAEAAGSAQDRAKNPDRP